jgi:hypothetical protein
MDLMTIGAFAERTRLSAKALRLYDRLGLVRPVRTNPARGLDQGTSSGAGRRSAPGPDRRPADRRARHPGLRPQRPAPVNSHHRFAVPVQAWELVGWESAAWVARG